MSHPRRSRTLRPGRSLLAVAATPPAAARCGLLLLLLGVAGCAVGPDFTPPAPPVATGYTREPLASPGAGRAGRRTSGRAGQRFALGSDVPAEWWGAFRSPALSELVRASLLANPSIEAATAAVRAARESARADRGAFFPQIGAGFAATRSKAANDLSAPLADNSYRYNLFTPQLTASYSPDFFGAVARRVEASEAQAEIQRFQYEATSLTLASNVASGAIQEASLRGQLEALRKVVALQRDHLGLIRKQQDLGQATGADVVQQEAALAQFEQLVAPLEKQLAQQRNLLTALAGRFPADEVAQRFTLASIRLPAVLPVSLPGDLVRQRPDVRAAEAALHAASAEIGVAIANRLPQVTLTANAGLSATALSALGGAGAQFYTLAAGVAQPIFDGETLYRKQRAAEEALAQANAQYRSTVIGAMQNVADALRALQADARAVRASMASVEASSRSLDLIRKQLQEGAVDSTALILAQQSYFQALVTDVQAKATRLTDAVALFQALGGGWWNRPEPTSLRTAELTP